jgi:hypothetical protein
MVKATEIGEFRCDMGMECKFVNIFFSIHIGGEKI